MLMMSAGARHGYRPLLPFLLGLLSGKFLLNLLIATGGATLFDHPVAMHGLALISAAYLIFLAVQGWSPKNNTTDPKPALGYRAGLILHPLNPKAWTMITLTFVQFSPHAHNPVEHYLLIPLSFMVIQFFSHSAWCMAGVALKTTLTHNLLLHRTLILLTIAVIFWVLIGSFRGGIQI